jgi:hypothetical protein
MRFIFHPRNTRNTQKSDDPRSCSKIWCKLGVQAVIFPVQDLFGDEEDLEVERADSAPLATRMRPRSLDELVGQEHILAPGKLLRRAIEADRLPSVIFSGPPWPESLRR